MANTIETIPSKEDSVMLVGTHVSFKTFKKALWGTLEDSNCLAILCCTLTLKNCLAIQDGDLS